MLGWRLLVCCGVLLAACRSSEFPDDGIERDVLLEELPPSWSKSAMEHSRCLDALHRDTFAALEREGLQYSTGLLTDELVSPPHCAAQRRFAEGAWSTVEEDPADLSLPSTLVDLVLVDPDLARRERACAILIEHHVRNVSLDGTRRLDVAGARLVPRFLERVAEHNPWYANRLDSRIALARNCANRATVIRTLRSLPGVRFPGLEARYGAEQLAEMAQADPTALELRARGLFEALSLEGRDPDLSRGRWRMTRDTTWITDMAVCDLNELDIPRIDVAAPTVQVLDAHGARTTLAGVRGKIVVLYETSTPDDVRPESVERWLARWPSTLIAYRTLHKPVEGDATRRAASPPEGAAVPAGARAQNADEALERAWRHSSGSLTTLIDARGVIRARGLCAVDTEAAIAALVSELSAITRTGFDR